MAFSIRELAQAVQESKDLEGQLAHDATGITIWGKGRRDVESPRFMVLQLEGEWALLQGFFRVQSDSPTTLEQTNDLLARARERVQNDGLNVPVVLQGGPRNGERHTWPRRDLDGWQILPHDWHGADFYAWGLERGPDGEYVCEFDRTRDAAELTAFLRGTPPPPHAFRYTLVRHLRSIDVFDREPYRSLGKRFLQEQCDAWLLTDVAKERSVTRLRVGGGKCDVALHEIAIAATAGAAPRGTLIRFPMEDLLDFILERAPIPESAKSAERQHLRVVWNEHPELFRCFTRG